MCVICFADLTPDDLYNVMESIADARAKWEFIGLALKIRRSDLDAIAMKQDVDERFKEMLKKWLTRIDPPPSWEGLVKALESRMVDHLQLARRIAIEHNIPLSGKDYYSWCS